MEREPDDDDDMYDHDDSALETEAAGGMEVPVAADNTNPQEVTPKLKERKPNSHERSRYGLPFPSLPTTMVKRIVKTSARSLGSGKTRLNKEALTAITQASDWFFEQLGEDLGAYADHARRRTIDETDMITLMRRSVLLTVRQLCF